MKSTTNFRALTQSAVAMIVATFAFVACSDYDNGYTEQNIAYDEQFTNLFGQIDPNQDWSMAAYVSAKVAVPNAVRVARWKSTPMFLFLPQQNSLHVPLSTAQTSSST